MATKKRKICDEHRFFYNSWVDLYFFVEHKGKPLCLISQKTVAVMKEYNIKLMIVNINQLLKISLVI